MAWLRYDDNETDHAKVLALIELAGYEAYYRLHKLHGYCARHRNRGHFPAAAARELGIRPKLLAAMKTVGLVDDEDGGLSVHDWDEYNPSDPTAAERMRRHRRNASRNGTVTEGVTEPSPDRNADRDSRVGARARPVPSPTPELKATAAGTTPDAAQTDAAAALAQIGITDPTLVNSALNEPARAIACATHAKARATTNPAGLYRRIFDSGDWPTTIEPTTTNDDFDHNAGRYHDCDCGLSFHTRDELDDHRKYAHFAIEPDHDDDHDFATLLQPEEEDS